MKQEVHWSCYNRLKFYSYNSNEGLASLYMESEGVKDSSIMTG
jgi:hypothetical protein